MRIALRSLFVAGLLAVLGAGSMGAAPGIGGFEGVWVRDARERDDAARDAEIMRATEPMSFAFRGFARGVMRSRMVPSERFVVEQRTEGPAIQDDKGMMFPLDGRAHETEKDHEVTTRLRDDGQIEQTWKEGADSHGTTLFRIDGGGQLVVSQHVIDSHFTTPIEYATTYRRTNPP